MGADPPEKSAVKIADDNTGGNATTSEMVRLSFFILGGRFVYITVFVFNNGVLQNRGVSEFLTAVSWSIAGPTGLVLIYLFGAWSDSCTSSWGRRRPFLLVTAIFLCLGLIMVPFSEPFVQLFDPPDMVRDNSTGQIIEEPNYANPWSIALTLGGSVLLYKFLKLCWSPSRAYMADATNSETYAKGMSIFTIMSSVGSFGGGIFGYIDWEKTFISGIFNDEFEFVYLVTVLIMIISTIICLTSYKETPLRPQKLDVEEKPGTGKYEDIEAKETKTEYSTFEKNGEAKGKEVESSQNVSLKESLRSVVCMPGFLFVLFMCTFLGMAWYSFFYIYLTDFLGKVVFGGNPSAKIGSPAQRLYIQGVRVGSLCMAVDSVAAVLHALLIIKLVDKFGIKPLYVGGQALGTLAMILVASIHHPACIYTMSIITGIMYSTIQTFPYMLLVQYHKAGLFKGSKRGLGTDMAIFTTTLSLSQFFGSFLVGTLLKIMHTMAVAMWCAAGASLLGMLVALFVRYESDDENALVKNEQKPAVEMNDITKEKEATKGDLNLKKAMEANGDSSQR